MSSKFTRTVLGGLAASLLLSASFVGTAMAADVTLSFLVDNTDASTVKVAQALVDAFVAKNPTIAIEIETRPGGGDGDNIIKTRLATGEMTDVFLYNAGSLFQAINPAQNLSPLTAEPFEANVIDTFKKTVSVGSDVYGVPFATAMGGGIMYNKKIYADLGLSVPKTWDEFMANNEKIKAAGKVAVIQSFADTWTSQLFVLGDFYNVLAAEPDFPAKYTGNQAKYATDKAAIKGFERQEAVFKAGYLNPDFAAAKFDDAIRMLATGEGAHYPMLSFAAGNVVTNYPENQKDVGFFAIPGDDAAKNGLTAWMPSSLYIPKSSEHQAEAKEFLAFVASTAGCDAQTAAVGATGPYLIKDCTLPADVPSVVADLLPYFQKDGGTAPALEFLSPIKGPALEQITVEVGSGIRSAADGAALYDEDVKKQAQQLGLAGW
ncbi:extracellular solute-binding protein [Devosia sp.]|uniref:ABC transporter substrate-binding protein n=1 Tax=Devosia sp. TaxID=1871048 RepID=UPI0032655774